MKRVATEPSCTSRCISRLHNRSIIGNISNLACRGIVQRGEGQKECIYCRDLYGGQAREVALESGPFILRKIRNLEKEIDKLPGQLQEAYRLALEQEIKQRTNYVRSTKLLLTFLRADNFDASKAAVRMAKFYKHKLELFGVHMLPRRILQSDLNEDDHKVLSSGVYYFSLDCYGRLVILIQRGRLRLFGLIDEHYEKSIRRVTMYQIMFCVEQEEDYCSAEQIQIKGVVTVQWGIDCTLPLKDFRIIFLSNIKMMAEAIPLRANALHPCINSSLQGLCISWLQLTLPKSIQSKVNVHNGSPQQCLDKISEYGIDVEGFPLTSTNGDFKVEVHKQQIAYMREKESSNLNRSSSTATTYANKAMARVVKSVPNNSSIIAIDTVGPCSSESHCVDESTLRCGTEHSNGKHSEALPRAPATADGSSNHKESLLIAESHTPSKLMQILDRNAYSNVIWWSSNGTAFTIDKTKIAKTGVLATEFRGIKLDSFLRRLRRCGFQRLSPKSADCAEFQHPLFKKGLPQLLKNWGGVSSKDKLPLRMMKVLSSTEKSTNNKGIWWTNNGKAFAIHKSKFTTEILENQFGDLKWASFVRMLQRWKFSRLADEERSLKITLLGRDKTREKIFVFYHPIFQRNSPLSDEIMEKWHYLEGLAHLGNNINATTTRNREEQRPDNKKHCDVTAKISKGEDYDSFRSKIFQILEEKTAEQAIWWLEENNNQRFAIQENLFTRDILCKDFNGMAFSTFDRSLKRWGFKKLETNNDVSTWECPNLLKFSKVVGSSLNADDGHNTKTVDNVSEVNNICTKNIKDKRYRKQTATTMPSQPANLKKDRELNQATDASNMNGNEYSIFQQGIFESERRENDHPLQMESKQINNNGIISNNLRLGSGVDLQSAQLSQLHYQQAVLQLHNNCALIINRHHCLPVGGTNSNIQSPHNYNIGHSNFHMANLARPVAVQQIQRPSPMTSLFLQRYVNPTVLHPFPVMNNIAAVDTLYQQPQKGEADH